MATEKTQKYSQRYVCKSCDFASCNKNDYNRHLMTIKHVRNKTATLSNTEILKKDNNIFLCDNCNKEYNDRTGLWRHKKTCIINKYDDDNDNDIDNSETNNNFSSTNFDTSIVLELVKKNQEFQKEMFLDLQKQMFDFMKDKIGDNNSTNIINSNNKTFNLQVFLNETCKDAMNIKDFVESVKLQVTDLENVGKVGYIEGISNIIIKNLKALDVEKRPVHCTDKKREVMYVKDENIWEKEDENNKKLRKAIRMIAHKNICMLKEFREKYPDCEEYDSNKNSQYNKIVYEAMGGKGDNDYEKDTKIIKKIANVVGIDKTA
jgi:hypothetical protein